LGGLWLSCSFYMRFTLFGIVTLLTAVASLLLGLIVFLQPTKGKLNRRWFLVSLATFFWAIGLAGVVSSTSEETAMYFQYLLDVGGLLIPLFFYYFVITVLNKDEERRREVVLLSILVFIIILLSFSSFFKVGLIPFGDFRFWVVPGQLYFFFPAIFLVLVLRSIYLLIRAYYYENGVLLKQQIKYVLIAGIIGFAGGITNFFPQIFSWYPFGNFFVIFYVGAITYAIIRHRLMNVRLVITRSFLFSILVLVVSTVFTLATLLASHIVETTNTSTLIWTNLIVAIVVVLFLNPLRNFLARVTDSIFFKGQIDYEEVAKKLSRLIANILDRDKLLNQFSSEVKKSLKLKKAEVLFCGDLEKTCGFYQSGSRKENRKGKALISSYQQIVKFFNEYTEIKVREEEERKAEELIGGRYKHQLEKTVKALEDKKIAVVVPVRKDHKVNALVFLGNKESGDIFDNRDIRLLEILRSQLASALEKSGMYEELKLFNIKLKQKVKKATTGLRAANKRLRELDKAKTLFLSVASHQLRTPLSGIKGYLSMVLEGDFGKPEKKIKNILQEVYANTNRLIRLVGTFLDVSRIESGRLEVIKTKNDLVEMSQKIVNELQFSAKDKGIKLFIESNKDKIMAKVDIDKLEDVLVNLTDNAIKYTEKGLVVVKLIEKKKCVRFEVQDTGQGLEKSEIKNLFNKFVRGSRGLLSHTDGSGLGLYIAKRIIELHNGRIGVDSKGKGKGCTFWFEVPKK